MSATDEHTYEYPSWWNEATTVTVIYQDAPTFPVTADREDVEFLPLQISKAS